MWFLFTVLIIFFVLVLVLYFREPRYDEDVIILKTQQLLHTTDAPWYWALPVVVQQNYEFLKAETP